MRKLVLIILFLSSYSNAQSDQVTYYNDIDFKDILEFKGLIYFESDTTLVTGRIIKYNKKKEKQSFLLVEDGDVVSPGWEKFQDEFVIPTGRRVFDYNDEGRKYDERRKEILRSKSYEVNRSNHGFVVIDNEANKKEDTLHTNGNPKFKGRFVEGKKNGYWEEYYYDGELKNKGKYINDKLEGIWKQYYYNGVLKNKGNYVDGYKVGIWEEYYEDGQLHFSVNYINGKKEGICEEFYEIGLLRSVGNYSNDYKINEWKYYDDQGDILGAEHFDENGKLIKTEIFD